MAVHNHPICFWECEIDENVWHTYDNHISNQLENGYNTYMSNNGKNGKELQFQREGYAYKADFERNTQINCITKSERLIRRSEKTHPQKAKPSSSSSSVYTTTSSTLKGKAGFHNKSINIQWECEIDDRGGWYPYNDNISTKLENHYKAKNSSKNVDFERDGQKYIADLVQYTQKNCYYGTMHKIRRREIKDKYLPTEKVATIKKQSRAGSSRTLHEKPFKSLEKPINGKHIHSAGKGNNRNIQKSSSGGGGGGGGSDSGGVSGNLNHPFSKYAISTKPKDYKVDLRQRKEDNDIVNMQRAAAESFWNDDNIEVDDVNPNIIPVQSNNTSKGSSVSGGGGGAAAAAAAAAAISGSGGGNSMPHQRPHAGREAAFKIADKKLKEYQKEQLGLKEKAKKEQIEREQQLIYEHECERKMKEEQDFEYLESLKLDQEKKKSLIDVDRSADSDAGGADAGGGNASWGAHGGIVADNGIKNDVNVNTAIEGNQVEHVAEKIKPEVTTTRDNDLQVKKLLKAIKEYPMPIEPHKMEKENCCNVKVRYKSQSKTRRFNYKSNTLKDVAIFALISSSSLNQVQSESLSSSGGGGGDVSSSIEFALLRGGFKLCLTSPSTTLLSDADMMNGDDSLNSEVMNQSLESIGISKNTMLILEFDDDNGY